MSDPEFSLKPSLEQAASALADQAFSTIEQKYGLKSQDSKAYHNIVHSRDVVHGITTLADLAIARGKITSKDKALLTISAAFHDIEQNLGSGANEAASSQKAQAAMEKTGIFTVADQETVNDIIMGTQIYFENGIMLQTASNNSLLAQLMADADLSSLGRPTDIYVDRSMGLLRELAGDNPTVEDQRKFLEGQITLLTHHTYYTDEAREAFPYKVENILYTESMLGLL